MNSQKSTPRADPSDRANDVLTAYRFALLALVMSLLVLVPAAAHANGADATHRLFEHWRRAHIHYNGVEESSVTARPTLVHGLYALYSHGRWVSTFNDAGTLWIGQGQIYVLPDDRYRQISAEEKAAFRSEVLRNIAWDRLIRVKYGDGGGRRILELSAIDCPVCQRFEAALRHSEKLLNSTFYVIPSSLQEISQGAEPTWRNVARIWCAKDNAAAWKTYWAKHELPAEQPCDWNAGTADDAIDVVVSVLKAVGVPEPSTTPAFIIENGERLPANTVSRASGDATLLTDTFGPSGRARDVEGSGDQWLLMAALR